MEAPYESKTGTLQDNPIPPPPPEPPTPQKPHRRQIRISRKHVFLAVFIAVLLVTSTISVASMNSVYNLNQQVSLLQAQIDSLSASQEGIISVISYGGNVSFSQLYAELKNSVVTIECTITEYYYNQWGQLKTTTSTVQGSGFVYEYENQMVIITNNHVIEDATEIAVTFADENNYTATVLGADSANDIAVLSTNAPDSEYYPLKIASSSTLNVGDFVIAIGSPYGLSGTMTTGIISALDRTVTITEDTSSYTMTGLIQTSAPINSGNSGGPLMTIGGEVIGVTTAIVSDSDGLGFAIPSDTILSVIAGLL